MQTPFFFTVAPFIVLYASLLTPPYCIIIIIMLYATSIMLYASLLFIIKTTPIMLYASLLFYKYNSYYYDLRDITVVHEVMHVVCVQRDERVLTCMTHAHFKQWHVIKFAPAPSSV